MKYLSMSGVLKLGDDKLCGHVEPREGPGPSSWGSAHTYARCACQLSIATSGSWRWAHHALGIAVTVLGGQVSHQSGQRVNCWPLLRAPASGFPSASRWGRVGLRQPLRGASGHSAPESSSARSGTSLQGRARVGRTSGTMSVAIAKPVPGSQGCSASNSY
jgi:hypothetical protein